MQRFDSALRLNVHFHVRWLDGEYGWEPGRGELEFHEHAGLCDADVQLLVLWIRDRVLRALRKAGKWVDAEDAADGGYEAATSCCPGWWPRRSKAGRRWASALGSGMVRAGPLRRRASTAGEGAAVRGSWVFRCTLAPCVRMDVAALGQAAGSETIRNIGWAQPDNSPGGDGTLLQGGASFLQIIHGVTGIVKVGLT